MPVTRGRGGRDGEGVAGGVEARSQFVGWGRPLCAVEDAVSAAEHRRLEAEEF